MEEINEIHEEDRGINGSNSVIVLINVIKPLLEHLSVWVFFLVLLGSEIKTADKLNVLICCNKLLPNAFPLILCLFHSHGHS